jgi:hypothetical protein
MKTVVILILLGVASQYAYAWDKSLANCDEALRAKGLCGADFFSTSKLPQKPAAPTTPKQQPVAASQPSYQYSPVDIQNPDPYVQNLIKSRNRTMSDPQFGAVPALLTHVERIDAQILSYVAKYHQK